ncbi:Tyrosinase central domain-containing protein [Mycena venus]|uniref:Tyrosinase central domain-containing protein n=1 Tax=Mycena venus TaxID=2733690 RepID=A0A8H6YWE2_9AGAR|nr:Tyrosinase central domain-containing protein [Mycena venus]
MDSEPLFPPEIEREIFETTALVHSGTIFALLRVARRVLIWIEPLLYRVIRVGHENSSMVRALVDALASKPPEFVHHAVRHLGLDSIYSPCTASEGRQLLALCKGLVNFGSTNGFTDPLLLPLLAEMHVQRLALNLVDLFGATPIDLAHPLFRSVTHFDIFGFDGIVEVLPDVPLLPALTHLCVNSHISRQMLLNVLVDCPRLRLLLVQWHSQERDSYDLARAHHEYDARFVIGLYGDYWAEWEAGARGLPDQWTQGDDFIARKRNGEIEATRYWLE